MINHNFKQKTLRSVEIERCTISNNTYTKDYVRELEQELHRLIKENTYLKSDDYINRVLANQKITDTQKENESMSRKINFLTLLVRELSHNSVNREDILITLKAILDGDFSEFSPSITSQDTYITNGKIHEFTQYLSLKHNIPDSPKKFNIS